MRVKPVAFVRGASYGRGMSSTRAPLQPCCPVPARVDERFFGPQVPGENPVHWIAERAPPAGS